MFKNNYITVALFVIILLFTGCDNWLTGYGPQPIYIDKPQDGDKLNIMGILKPGVKEGKPLSFIHLEKTVPATEEYPDTVEVTDAIITLSQFAGEQLTDSVKFEYTDFSQTFSEFKYRPQEFQPQEAQTYHLSCKKEGFPEIVSKTTLPHVPQIIENSLKTAGEKLVFTIKRDILAALYDIYLQIGEIEYFARVIRPENGNIDVTLNFYKGNEQQGNLIVYVYDLKLSEYITYNVIVKPNTYHESYTTVENGYGCFGSLNILEKTISF
jgi:hypothetical protein